MLPEGVALRDLGRHRLKDLDHPERLYDLAIDGLRSEFPLLRSLEAHPNNLPPQRSTFVGRDIATVIALVRGNRLVTLTGPGGCGEDPALARNRPRPARRVPRRRVLRRPLPNRRSGARPVDGCSDPRADRTGGANPLETVRRHLRDLRLLLVLNNFEQIVDAAETVEWVLEGAANLHVLVTSRIPLHLYVEQEFAVPPLGLPDPARLPPLEQLSQYKRSSCSSSGPVPCERTSRSRT